MLIRVGFGEFDTVHGQFFENRFIHIFHYRNLHAEKIFDFAGQQKRAKIAMGNPTVFAIAV